MREASAEVVAIWRNKDLRFVHQSAERFSVNDAISIALELVAHSIW
jgi:hypothetical protein